jgi:arylsulfatase A-like enzyme
MTTRRPNILFVLADDLGWGDVGFHGSQIATPTLDALAETGVELTQHYVCPMCTPTRASLLTGRYPGRFGAHATVPSNKPVLPDGYPTLATVLRDAGYQTGLFGKWHLGSDAEYGPNAFGFDHGYGSLAGGIDPYNHHYKRGKWSRTWHRNGEPASEAGHVTDLIIAEAQTWLASRPADVPWFCYVPFTAVHVPVKAPPNWIARYDEQTYDDDPTRDESFKAYAGYTSHMDAGIASLLDTLDAMDARDDTLIIFASDNGAIPNCDISGVADYPGDQQSMPLLGSNLPFRGQKAQMYEGGIRTPTIVNWTGTLDAGPMDHPVAITDWMPTLLTLADAEPTVDPMWDGDDIWSLITGERDEPIDRELYWNFHANQFALRSGAWKLIARGETLTAASCELYNIETDPYETRDLASDDPTRVRNMLARLEIHRTLDYTTVRPDV